MWQRCSNFDGKLWQSYNLSPTIHLKTTLWQPFHYHHTTILQPLCNFPATLPQRRHNVVATWCVWTAEALARRFINLISNIIRIFITLIIYPAAYLYNNTAYPEISLSVVYVDYWSMFHHYTRHFYSLCIYRYLSHKASILKYMNIQAY